MSVGPLPQPSPEVFRTAASVGTWRGEVFFITLFGALDAAAAAQSLERLADVVRTHGRRVPLVVDARALVAMPREARVMISERSGPLVTREAIIIGSPLTRMLANIMNTFHRPLHPQRMFTDEAEALLWVREGMVAPADPRRGA